MPLKSHISFFEKPAPLCPLFSTLHIVLVSQFFKPGCWISKNVDKFDFYLIAIYTWSGFWK